MHVTVLRGLLFLTLLFSSSAIVPRRFYQFEAGQLLVDSGADGLDANLFNTEEATATAAGPGSECRSGGCLLLDDPTARGWVLNSDKPADKIYATLPPVSGPEYTQGWTQCFWSKGIAWSSQHENRLLLYSWYANWVDGANNGGPASPSEGSTEFSVCSPSVCGGSINAPRASHLKPVVGTGGGGSWIYSLNPYQWNHFCISFGPSNTQVFVNGVKRVDEGALNWNPGADPITVVLGRKDWTNYGAFFSSFMLDDFMIFDSQIDPTTALDVYNGNVELPKGPTTSSSTTDAPTTSSSTTEAPTTSSSTTEATTTSSTPAPTTGEQTTPGLPSTTPASQPLARRVTVRIGLLLQLSQADFTDTLKQIFADTIALVAEVFPSHVSLHNVFENSRRRSSGGPTLEVEYDIEVGSESEGNAVVESLTVDNINQERASWQGTMLPQVVEIASPAVVTVEYAITNETAVDDVVELLNVPRLCCLGDIRHRVSLELLLVNALGAYGNRNRAKAIYALRVFLRKAQALDCPLSPCLLEAVKSIVDIAHVIATEMVSVGEASDVGLGEFFKGQDLHEAALLAFSGQTAGL